MKRKKFKDYKRKPQSHYKNTGDDVTDVSFEDTAPKSLPATYGPRAEKEYAPGFVKKQFRDLAFGQVTIKVNPTDEAGDEADPYAIIGPTNPVIDAKYLGKDNTSGNIIMQLAHGSESNLDNVMDFITEEVIINYNCAKHTAADNASTKVNDSFYYPWADIDSSIQAEAFYDLPFFKWQVSGTTYYDDPLLDIVDFYQVVLQAVYQIPLRYKVLRGMEKELKDMCYQNGDSIMNALFGRLKKAVLINTINGISEAISTHFLDSRWLNKISKMIAIPCRKAKGMLDPLLEVTVKYEYNNSLVVSNASGQLFTTGSQDYADLFTAINNVLDALTMKKVLTLARNNATYAQIQTWANGIADDVNTVTNKLKTFTKNFADFNVAFKRMAKAGYTNWELGKFLLIKDINETFEPKFNKMVYDIIRTSFTGASKIEYDPKINQWKTLSIWDKFTGIPTYDEKAGGSVYTFSTKDVVYPTGYNNPQPYAALFRFGSCYGLTRQGVSYTISRESTTLSSGPIGRVLGRLVPTTGFNSTEFWIPSVDVSSIVSPAKQAWVVEAVQHVFGYCKAVVATNTYNYSISDDLLTAIDFQIDDLKNSIDTDGKLNAPFRVLKSTTKQSLGVAN